MSVEENLKKFNIELPEPKNPVGAYIATKSIGNYFLFLGKFQSMLKETL